MSREYVADILERELQHLSELLQATDDHVRYRAVMRELGSALGLRLRPRLQTQELVVACSVEDADFLARGMLEVLEEETTVHLACFWNRRQMLGRGYKVAPSFRRYVEPFEAERVSQLVVAKSIISSGCVVRTHILEMLETLRPEIIFVVAPVMHAGSRDSLESDFPPAIASRFCYVYLAEDSEREDHTIRPGVGGSVYELLGLGSQAEKNRHTPSLVSQRQEARWARRA